MRSRRRRSRRHPRPEADSELPDTVGIGGWRLRHPPIPLSCEDVVFGVGGDGDMSANARSASARWVDRKRPLWLLALVMPLLPFMAIGMFTLTGLGVWLWLGPIVILGVVPAIDWLTGADPSNPPDDALARLESDRYYRWLTFLFLPLQYAAFVLACWTIVNGPLTTTDRIGLAVTVGFIGGLGINTAHELGHKRESHERWLSRLALTQTGYGHFFVEHNRGHHVRVATPQDPASARLGESFYRFWPRTVLGSLRSAWTLERGRIQRRGGSPVRFDNDVVAGLLLTVLLWAALLVWLGPVLLPFLILQAIVGFTLLEAVNYLEHYGLLRQRVGVGDRERYERVAARHSWNANQVTTNVLLYHLQRHSDHHANPTRRYQALRDDDTAPVLPAGYAAMILLALIPPLWFRVMDPRVIAHYDGDVMRANLHPPRRARLLRRFPPADARTTAASKLPTQSAATAQLGAGSEPIECPGCGYRYDPTLGDRREGFLPGTSFLQIPEDWPCPDCGVRCRAEFVPAASPG